MTEINLFNDITRTCLVGVCPHYTCKQSVEEKNTYKILINKLELVIVALLIRISVLI